MLPITVRVYATKLAYDNLNQYQEYAEHIAHQQTL